jgi:hypothetical protein
VTDTQKKLALTLGFALVVGGLIALRISQSGPTTGDAGAESGSTTTSPPNDVDAGVRDASAPSNPDAQGSGGAGDADAPGSVDAGGAGDTNGAADAAASVDAASQGAGGTQDAGDAGAASQAPSPWSDPDADEAVHGQILSFLQNGRARDAGPAAKRVRLGPVLVPTGKLGVYDCLGHDYTSAEEVIIPSGSYAVDVWASTDDATASGHVYAVELKVSGAAKAVTLKRSYAMLSGTMKVCFASPEAIRAFQAFEQDAGADVLTGIGHGDGGSRLFGYGTLPKSKLGAAMVDGAGHATPVYLGYDDKGRVTGVVVPLEAP